MVDGKENSKASLIGLIGGIVGLVGGIFSAATFGFSIYQWNSTQEQIKVNAAIDISKNYLQQRELRDVQDLILNQTREKPYDAIHLRQRAFVDLNDYIARLETAGLIDKDYVSVRIKCDIGWIDRTIRGPTASRSYLKENAQGIRRYVEAGLVPPKSECDPVKLRSALRRIHELEQLLAALPPIID